jgi:hypothetical protein
MNVIEAETSVKPESPMKRAFCRALSTGVCSPPATFSDYNRRAIELASKISVGFVVATQFDIDNALRLLYEPLAGLFVLEASHFKN